MAVFCFVGEFFRPKNMQNRRIYGGWEPHRAHGIIIFVHITIRLSDIFDYPKKWQTVTQDIFLVLEGVSSIGGHR